MDLHCILEIFCWKWTTWTFLKSTDFPIIKHLVEILLQLLYFHHLWGTISYQPSGSTELPACIPQCKNSIVELGEVIFHIFPKVISSHKSELFKTTCDTNHRFSLLESHKASLSHPSIKDRVFYFPNRIRFCLINNYKHHYCILYLRLQGFTSLMVTNQTVPKLQEKSIISLSSYLQVWLMLSCYCHQCYR